MAIRPLSDSGAISMTDVNSSYADLKALGNWYSREYGDAAPSAKQWERLLSRPVDAPVTIVNFFKMHDEAVYCTSESKALSGQEAFDQYAAVSIPALAKAGGEFLMVSPFEASFIGEEEDWDLIAIGSYPNTKAVFALFLDDNYKAAYAHRAAACIRQKVLLANT